MRFALTLALALIAQASFGQTVVENIPPVVQNPLAMTISSVLVQPKSDHFHNDQILLLPKRGKVSLLEKASKLNFTYKLQSKKDAPLIFVLPGLGGDFRASGALFIAEKLFALGYSTVTLDNPFSWTFSVSGSRSGMPGYMVEDSRDLYQALLKINQKLKTQRGARPRAYALAGYSLGGLQSLFLKNIDRTEKHFNFSHVLTINPPLDLLHAVNQLDAMYVRGQSLSESRKAYVFTRLLDVGGDVLASKKPFSGAQDLQNVFDRLHFNDSDLSYIVALSFRLSLKDVIFASQQVKDSGLLRNRVSEFYRNARYNEAGNIFFADYMERFVFPRVKAQKDLDYSVSDLNEESSIYQFADLIRNDSGIFFVHSQDDFLLKNGDLAWAKDIFGPRALVFPYGGHCGAMGFTQFEGFLKQIFTIKR
ncbi:Alpha/beta hydrolase family protein [compost metagenome]